MGKIMWVIHPNLQRSHKWPHLRSDHNLEGLKLTLSGDPTTSIGTRLAQSKTKFVFKLV